MANIIRSDSGNPAIDLDLLRAVVIEQLVSRNHSLAKVAGLLKLSPRTLQRRLLDYGISYSQLVDEVRFMRARNMIIQREKLSQIASKLGYADAGSFTRAFERWTGMTPRNYRNKFYNGSIASQSSTRV